MSRLLFDQNVPVASVHRIRRAGHDVLRIEAGESDLVVLERARSEARFVVTYDRDFGFLAVVAASAAGWLSDAAVRPIAGVAASMVLSLVLSSVAFVIAKRFFEDLRDGR